MAGMYSEKCILRQNHWTSTIGGSQSLVASGRYPDVVLVEYGLLLYNKLF